MELQRLVRKKAILVTMVFLLALLLADICWNGSKMESKRQYTATQLSYIKGYQGYIASILASGEKMNGISVFAQQDSVTQKNVVQTCKDYKRVKVQHLSRIDGRGVELYFHSRFLWIVGCIFGLFVAGIVSGKQTAGLEELLHSCKRGRGALLRSKYASLILLSIGFTILCNLLSFTVCVYWWQPEQIGKVLQSSIQSVPMCKDVVFCCKVWQWMLVYLAMQCLLHCICSVIFFGLRLLDTTKLWAYVLFVLFVLIEFVLYHGIKANSAGAVWKYVNIIYALTNACGLFVYRNLVIGGHLYAQLFVMIVAMLLVAMSVSLLAFLICFRRYPNKEGGRCGLKCERLSKKWQIWYGKWMERQSMIGMELCKVLLFQKGWLLLILLCVWGYCSLDYTDISFSVAEQMKTKFLQENTGPICSTSKEALGKIKLELDQVEQEYALASEQYEKKQLSERQYLASSIKYSSYDPEREFYQKISNQTKYLEHLKKTKGMDGWYLQDESFEYLVRLHGMDWIRKGIFPLGLAILVLLVFKEESRIGMFPVLSATATGKKIIKRAKRKCIASVTGIVWLVMLLFELWNTWNLYGIRGLEAPAQSIKWLQWIPVPCTMGMFLLLYYLLRYCIFYVCAYWIARCGEWKKWN